MNIDRISTGLTALALSLASTITAHADSTSDMAAKFGARQQVRNVSISPGGGKVVAVISLPAGGENVVVINLADGKITPIFSSKGDNNHIRYCEFILDTRAVCQLHLTEGKNSEIDSASRMISLAADGSGMKMLSAKPNGYAEYANYFGGAIIDYNVVGKPDSVLMMSWAPPEMTTGNIAGNRDGGMLIEEVDVNTAARKTIETRKPNVGYYFTDGAGQVRMMASNSLKGTGYYK